VGGGTESDFLKNAWAFLISFSCCADDTPFILSLCFGFDFSVEKRPHRPPAPLLVKVGGMLSLFWGGGWWFLDRF